MVPKIKNNIVEVKFGSKSKFFEFITDPVPHILIDSKKEIHGWWNSAKDKGNRACTSERLLINPYNGCSWNCFFCYANALWGYFELFQKENIVTVFKNFDKVVDKQLDSLLCASCGYISPITDPFQPINNKYHLTEKIMKILLKYELPVEIITKGVISNEAIEIMAEHPYNHSFGQVSILTLDDNLRKKLILGKGATTNQLLKNIERLANSNIHSVCRIDPIIPYVNDNIKDIKEIIDAAINAGANHIGLSILDIPIFIKDEILNRIALIKGKNTIEKYKILYTEKITSDLHSNIEYRKNLLRQIKGYCLQNKITMSTCMEFEMIKKDNKIFYESLNSNHQFMTSDNCEGINIPIYTRKNYFEKFKPVKCKGNCLYCKLHPIPCKIPPLQEAKDWKLKDYKEWSKFLKQKQFKELSSFIYK